MAMMAYFPDVVVKNCGKRHQVGVSALQELFQFVYMELVYFANFYLCNLDRYAA
jgi:hypothetical protein